MTIRGCFNVHGRRFYFTHLHDLTRRPHGRWLVYRNNVPYQIEGGKPSGASRHDWYVSGGVFSRPMRCSSLLDALRTLDGM